MTALDLQAYTLLATSLISVAVLVLNYLRERTPTQQVDDRFEKVEARTTALEEANATLQTWKNS